MPEKQRCSWAGSDPLMQQYHDQEWGRPVRDSREMWECLMLEGFQAGLSWQTILKRREGFRKAFKDFDPAKVAKFTEKDIDRLMQDEGIIRARAKIVATIEGAKIFLKMQKEGEDFAKTYWSFVGGKPIVNRTGKFVAETEVSQRISKDLKKRGFKFVGPVIVYAWMQAIGIADDHHPDCFRA